MANAVVPIKVASNPERTSGTDIWLSKIASAKVKAPISADLIKIAQISFNKPPNLCARSRDATYFGGEDDRFRFDFSRWI
jgi:hypothetical protein